MDRARCVFNKKLTPKCAHSFVPESPSSRASAREKLTRLTKLQFQELSTDVYDELMRRLAVERGEGETGALTSARPHHLLTMSFSPFLACARRLPSQKESGKTKTCDTP